MKGISFFLYNAVLKKKKKGKRHLSSLSFFGVIWVRSWTGLFCALCILILVARFFALPCLNRHANANGCFSVCRSYRSELFREGGATLLLWCLRQGILFGLRRRLICGGFKVRHSFWFCSVRGWWASCIFLPFFGMSWYWKIGCLWWWLTREQIKCLILSWKQNEACIQGFSLGEFCIWIHSAQKEPLWQSRSLGNRSYCAERNFIPWIGVHEGRLLPLYEQTTPACLELKKLQPHCTTSLTFCRPSWAPKTKVTEQS